MFKGQKQAIIGILILETVAIFSLGISNLQKSKTIVGLRLEIKSKLEELTAKDASIKELQKQAEELRNTAIMAEEKTKGLAENQKIMEGKVEGAKQSTEILAQQFGRQEKDVFEQIRSLTAENRKTYIVLLSKIETLLQAKTNLEKTIEKYRSAGADAEITPSTQQVQLNKIAVQKKNNPEPTAQYAGTVLEVNNEYEFAVVDIGKEKGVKPGVRFSVLRNEKKIGEIVIREVYNGMSIAEAVMEKSTLRFKRGDKLIPLQ